MSRSPRVSKRTAQVGAVLGALVLTTGAAVSVASITQVDDGWPRVYELGVEHNESHSCADLATDLIAAGILSPPAPSWQEFKIDNPTQGGHYGRPLDITISDYTDQSFSWSSGNGTGVDLVYVKSGTAASRLYLYDPPTEATQGTNLTVNKGISHITFCYDEGGTTTTTSSTTTTTVPSSTTTTGSTTTTVPSSTTTTGSTTTTVPSSTTTTGSTSTTVPSSTTTTEATSTTTGSTTTTAPSSTVTTAPTSTAPGTTVAVLGVTQEQGNLPTTGVTVGGLLVLAGALMLAGGLLELAAHRRLAEAEQRS